MSAESCMAGLFPPFEGRQKWNNQLNWQPIPVHTTPVFQDELFFTWDQCDRLRHASEEYTNTSEYKFTFEKNKSLIRYLEEKSGEKLDQLSDLQLFYDRLFVGRSKPEWYSIKINEKRASFDLFVNANLSAPSS